MNKRQRRKQRYKKYEPGSPHARRNVAFLAVFVVAALLVGASVLSQSPPSGPTFTYRIGNENWECQTNLHRGEVAGCSQSTKGVINPATLPSYVIGIPTSSNLAIDPDYASGTTTIYVGSNSAVAPKDGPKPKVIMSLSQVVPTDPTGQPLSSPVPAKEWDDTTGTAEIHWYQYYFYFEGAMKTESSLCNKPFGYMYKGDWVKNSYCGVLYEYEAVPVSMSFSVDLMSIYQNASFQSKFADARVIYVKSGYIPNTVTQTSFTTGFDYPANAWNDLDVNNKVNPTYDAASGTSDMSAVLTLSGTLQSGILFNPPGNTDSNCNYGVRLSVNTYIIYGILFSVQVTRPLTQSEREPEAAKITIIDYLLAVMQNPEDPMFWLLIVGVLAVVYLLIPKKKVAQALQQHLHIGERRPEEGF